MIAFVVPLMMLTRSGPIGWTPVLTEPPAAEGPAAAAPGEIAPAVVGPVSHTALELLPPETAAAAKRRARFVFKLPDGSVWDSFQYAEFRAARREAEAGQEAKLFPAEARAWGFDRGRMWPAGEESRPHPLWKTVSVAGDASRARAENDGATPFVYVNEVFATPSDKKSRPMAQVGRVFPGGMAEVTVTEYPGALGGEGSRLPKSLGLMRAGFASAIVKFPAGMTVKEGDSLGGEFFLVEDSGLERPRGNHASIGLARYVHAETLRLNAEQYAAELLAGHAVLVEWKFTKKTDKGEEYFEWRSRTLPVRAP